MTTTTPPPTPEAVEAALIFVNPDHLTMDQWVFACDKMLSEIIEVDQGRGAPQLAAAARILAAEVERLREQADAVCRWIPYEDQNGLVYGTSCLIGEIPYEEDPNFDQFPFCPACGRKVKIQQQTNEQ